MGGALHKDLEGMLTFVMAVYGQPMMLEKWWETVRSYDDEVLDCLHLVVVDDHGDPPAVIPDDVQAMLDCRLYRVRDDIPWNQMGARNLGMQECPTDWALMLDPDMVVEPEVAKRLIKLVPKMPPHGVSKLLLRYANDVFDASSPNVYLIRKDDFARVRGYDEDYRGNKGWSDVQLLHTLEAFGLKFVKAKEIWVRYYGAKEIKDATVTSLNRSVAINREIHIRKVKHGRRVGWIEWVRKHKGKNIRFEWERVL
jgi:hypothetical protein